MPLQSSTNVLEHTSLFLVILLQPTPTGFTSGRSTVEQLLHTQCSVSESCRTASHCPETFWAQVSVITAKNTIFVPMYPLHDPWLVWASKYILILSFFHLDTHWIPTALFLYVLYKFHLFTTFIVFVISFSFTYVPLTSLQLQDTFSTHSINISTILNHFQPLIAPVTSWGLMQP